MLDLSRQPAGNPRTTGRSVLASIAGNHAITRLLAGGRGGVAADAALALRNERGMSIVEVVVAGLILVVVSLGAGAAFTGAGARSSETRTRAVASSLAAQDQARMRTMKIFASSGFVEDRTLTVGATPYSVRSTARWLNDAGPEASCDAQSGSQPAAIQITSRVTSTVAAEAPTGGARIAPVEVRSLVSPSRQAYSGNTGTIAVPVVGRDGTTPVSGVTVSISGPQSASLPTNDAGCAVFGQVLPGTYDIVLDQDGWVGVTGVQRVAAEDVPVTRGALAKQAATRYQPAGSFNVSFTRGNGSASVPSLAEAVTVRNDAIGSGSKVTTLSPAASSGRVEGLFPATQDHTVYAGRCVPPDTTKGVASNVEPSRTADVAVPQAPLNAAITNASANQVVYAVWDKADCYQRIALQRQADGTIARATGDTSLPFGTWRLCVNKPGNTYVQTAAFTLTSATSNSRQTLNYNATAATGQCRTT